MASTLNFVPTRSIGTNTDPWPEISPSLPPPPTQATSDIIDSPARDIDAIPFDILNDWLRNNLPRFLSNHAETIAADLDGEQLSEVTIATDHDHESPYGITLRLLRQPVLGEAHSVSDLEPESLNEQDVIPEADPADGSRTDLPPEQEVLLQSTEEILADAPAETSEGTATSTDEGAVPEADAGRASQNSAPSSSPGPGRIKRMITAINKFFDIPLGPFALILFIQILFDHLPMFVSVYNGMLGFMWLDAMLKREVGKGCGRGLFGLLKIIALLVLYIGTVYMFSLPVDLRFHAVFYYSRTDIDLTNIWNVLWLVIVTDCLVKLLTQFAKFLILALPGAVLSFSKRGKYYNFIEQSSQLYRCTLPIYPWLGYYLNLYSPNNSILAIIFSYGLTVLYCLCKTVYFYRKVKALCISIRKLVSHVQYGKSPTKEELTNAGPDAQCAICFDDFKTPAILSCSHIYCNDCISEWFDRKRTCPTCRNIIVNVPEFRDGSTTQFVQIF